MMKKVKKLPWENPKSVKEDPDCEALVKTLMESPSYRLVEDDSDFLKSSDTRPLRLHMEYLKSELILQKFNVEQTIVVFGGARIKEPKSALKKFRKMEKKIKQDPGNTKLLQQLHDIDIFLSAVSDDGHITTATWGEKIGKEIMNAKVVFPGHYNVEGINHPYASGIIDAAQFTRMHDHTFINEKYVSLSKDDIKDYNFHVMYFGENVNWDVLKWPHRYEYTYQVAPLDEWPGDHREWEQYKPKDKDRY